MTFSYKVSIYLLSIKKETMQFHPLKVAFANLQISILLSINANLGFFQELSLPPTKTMLCQSFYKDYLIFFRCNKVWMTFQL